MTAQHANGRFMHWHGPRKFVDWLTAREARLTAVLLYLAATPVAMSLCLLINPLAFILWTLMWGLCFVPRRWPRVVLIIALTGPLIAVIGQMARPPEASFFMLIVLVFSAAEQVQDDGLPGAFNLIGVVFPALSAMVLSTSVVLFFLLLASVILYTGILTLRFNRMPLSGLRIRLLPIIVALSGSLFFAVIAFILLPRINPTEIPGFQSETAFSGVGDELAMGQFSEVILNSEDAFRAFLEQPLPRHQLYWRVNVLTRMRGSTWARDKHYNLVPGQTSLTTTLKNPRQTLRYIVRHTRKAPEWHPVLGVPLGFRGGPDTTINRNGEFIVTRPLAILDRQVELISVLDDPFTARLPVNPTIDGQIRLAAWARAMRERMPDNAAFADMVMQHFAENGYSYSLSPRPLKGPTQTRLDQFFFTTRQGYCSHYAMAMATVLRAASIPANVVVGYIGGEWNGYGGYYRIRQSDAHAWVEAELTPGQWTRFDPTQMVPDAHAHFEARARAVNSQNAAGWRGQVQRNLQRLDAFIVRLSSDVVLYDEAARQELLSGSFLGRLLSFASFWLFGSIMLGLPFLIWHMWLHRNPLQRLDRIFNRLAKKADLERAVDEGRLAFAKRWQGVQPAAASAIGGFAYLWCRVMFAGDVYENNRARMVALLRIIRRTPR